MFRFKPLAPLPKGWPNLPDTYGEGQRQYDMATASEATAEYLAWPASFSLAAVLGFAAGTAWLLAVAPVIYWVTMRPFRIRSREAGDLWEQEREMQIDDE